MDSMDLSIEEKQVLHAFACSDYGNTVKRLKFLSALTVDTSAKQMIHELARKVESRGNGEWYSAFQHDLRSEMEDYYCARYFQHLVETDADYLTRGY